MKKQEEEQALGNGESSGDGGAAVEDPELEVWCYRDYVECDCVCDHVCFCDLWVTVAVLVTLWLRVRETVH